MTLRKFAVRWLTPPLEVSGFRARGLTFARVVGETIQLIELQLGRPGTKEVRFTVNCGVYVPGLFALYTGAAEPPSPALNHCAVAVRIGMLKQDHLDRWWTLPASEEENRTVGMEVLENIRTAIMPFLDALSSREEIINYLSLPCSKVHSPMIPPSDPVRLVYLGILYHVCGDEVKAQNALTQAEVASQKGPMVRTLASVRRRLSSPDRGIGG